MGVILLSRSAQISFDHMIRMRYSLAISWGYTHMVYYREFLNLIVLNKFKIIFLNSKSQPFWLLFKFKHCVIILFGQVVGNRGSKWQWQQYFNRLTYSWKYGIPDILRIHTFWHGDLLIHLIHLLSRKWGYVSCTQTYKHTGDWRLDTWLDWILSWFLVTHWVGKLFLFFPPTLQKSFTLNF